MLEVKMYKNWKELCEEVGWNPNNRGNYKKARLKELDTLCRYYKEGNKIVVEEIYGELSEETNKRANNGGNSTKSTKEDDKRANNKNTGHSTSKYEMIDTLIYNQLSSIERIFTKLQLIKNVGLYVSKDDIVNSCNVNEYSINDFLDVYNSTINKLIDTALNRMSKNNIIEYSKVIVIDNSLSVIDMNSKVCKIIESIENETAKEMNIKNIYLLSEEEKKVFYDKCNQKVIEKGVCQEYYYRAFRIKKIDTLKNYNNNAKQDFLNKICKSIKKSKTFKSKIEEAENRFIKQKEIMTNKDDEWGDSIYDTFGEDIILENLSKVVCNRLSKNYSSDINSIISFIVKQGD